jgi:hypothetical protein
VPPVPHHAEARVAIFADPEVSSVSVSVECKLLDETTALRTLADYRHGLRRDLFRMAIDARSVRGPTRLVRPPGPYSTT